MGPLQSTIMLASILGMTLPPLCLLPTSTLNCPSSLPSRTRAPLEELTMNPKTMSARNTDVPPVLEVNIFTSWLPCQSLTIIIAAFARAYNLKTHMATHDPNRLKPHVCPHSS